MEVVHYQTSDGQDPFNQWLSGLKDRQAQARILTRIGRLAAGNMGDCKPLRDGVNELRIDYARGYRIYFARIGNQIVMLLAGGDKDTQQADIDKAILHLKDWKKRTSP
jgi:putative addiction module killer protein